LDIYSNSGKTRYYVKMILVSLLVAFQLVCSVEAGTINSFDLKLGKMADYGASPWYTEDILIGTSKLKFSPDSGANFTWATSDLCKTDACKDHQKVNTSQSGFVWIDAKPTKRSFGPWGSMMTKTCGNPFNSPKVASVEMDFFAAVEYAGAQFKFLAWDGGIGFPSTTAGVEKGSDFYYGKPHRTDRTRNRSLTRWPPNQKCERFLTLPIFHLGQLIHVRRQSYRGSGSNEHG